MELIPVNLYSKTSLTLPYLGGGGIHPPEDLFTRHFQKKGLIALNFADFS